MLDNNISLFFSFFFTPSFLPATMSPLPFFPQDNLNVNGIDVELLKKKLVINFELHKVDMVCFSLPLVF